MNLPIVIITSFLVTVTLIPVVIRVFKSINVLDKPDSRKIHSISTPSLGGIAMFIGIILSLFIAMPLVDIAGEKYFLGGLALIFFLGVRDDLSSLQANHKLIVQVFSASLLVFLMDLKIGGLNGLFGVDTFGWYFDEIFTIIVIAIMTNAFNLIDGIDGLAGSLGLLISLILCAFFFYLGDTFGAVLSFGIAGASIGFLLYNWYPSKVFMGDTGSMVLGFALTILMIRFLSHTPQETAFVSPVALVLSIFALPTYDTLRVFIIRFSTGKHPLAPDRNHIHHVLLKLGHTHGTATLILVGFNSSLIAAAYFLQGIGELWLILSLVTITVGLGIALDRKVMKREAARTASLYSSRMNISKTA
ncbi:MAG: MraY family glycosyltransferase [Bacteroidota bacterium]